MNSVDSGAQDEAIAEILKAEEERCRATYESTDQSTLRNILSDSYTYIHGSGRNEAKEPRLAGLLKQQATYASESRKDLEVRVFGDVAVMTGEVLRPYREDAIPADGAKTRVDQHTLMVWQREGDQWRLAFEQRNV